jgi:hypothetical protein
MRYFVPFLFAVSFIPLLASAQVSGIQDVIDNGVSLTITPSAPGANQNVTATLDSSSIDLDISIITWRVDGKTTLSGQGDKTLSLASGPVGSQTTISADISEGGGGGLNRSITFSPAEVDLMWQGGGYVPPFYEGRAMWTHQGQITFFAVPHVFDTNGTVINPKTLVYKWIQNDIVLGDSSGVNKNSLTLTDSILSLPETIEVDILTGGNTLLASQSINLTPQDPGLLIYEDNPLYGILFNSEAGDQFTALKKEFSFVALPLFFSTPTRNSRNISYDWEAGGATSGTNSRVTYSIPDTNTGSAQISISTNNSMLVTQSAQRNFLVQFGNQNSL